MKVDCVVVGSGISGLTSAAILASRGRSVALVEAQPKMGGSLRQFRRGGMSFDVGFHYTGCLGEGEILDLLWRYCGVRSAITSINLAVDGYDHYEFLDDSSPIRGYFDYERLAAELHSQFPEERLGIDLYLNTVQQICSQVPFYDTSLELTPFLRGYKEPTTPLCDFLGKHIRNPRLRTVLEAPAFLYGVPLSSASLEVHGLVSHGYYSGAWTVAGGGQAIVDAFLNRLENAGVSLLAGQEVVSILTERNGIRGVRLSGGETINCQQVIYTGHPSTLISRVPEKTFRPAYCHRLEGLRNTLSMFAVFAEAEKKVNTLSGALNYYFMPLECDVLQTVEPKQRPMMFTSTRTDRDGVLSGGENGIILLRLGIWQDVERFADSTRSSRTEEYERFKMEMAAEMIETAEQRWGNLTGTIQLRAAGTPLTFRDELSAPEGCTYGAMHCLDQYTPEVRTRLPGLYLAGQSTLMTGVVGASISGMVAAGEILGLEELWTEVRSCR